jgi:hypothetical protein
VDHTEAIIALRMLPDGRLFSVDRSTACHVWDVETGQRVHGASFLQVRVRSFAFFFLCLCVCSDSVLLHQQQRIQADTAALSARGEMVVFGCNNGSFSVRAYTTAVPYLGGVTNEWYIGLGYGRRDPCVGA